MSGPKYPSGRLDSVEYSFTTVEEEGGEQVGEEGEEKTATAKDDDGSLGPYNTGSPHPAGTSYGDIIAKHDKSDRDGHNISDPPLFVYHRRNNDGDRSEVDVESSITTTGLTVTAEEATIPVVDAAFASTTVDEREAHVRAMERRAAVAEAERLAAVNRLASAGQLFSKRQWLGMGLVVCGLMIVLAAAVPVVRYAVCGPNMCRRDNKMERTPPSTSTTTASGPTTAVVLSARAQYKLDYINNITLTGRTLTYPDKTTPEGRALAWLIEEEEVANEFDEINATTSTRQAPPLVRFDDEELLQIRQRYALGTLWFQTPADNNFDGVPLVSPNKTWATALPVCDGWYGVACDDEVNHPGLVTRLQLEGVDVHGTIPSDLALLTGLQYLGLNSNGLVGSIPASLGDHLPSLLELLVVDSVLTGTIPSSLRNALSLEILTIANTALTGTIPSELGELTYLRTLILNGNALNGTIPLSLTALTALFVLALRNNTLTGSIPTLIADRLTGLALFDLSENNLTGRIPPSWSANLTVLNTLGLSSNALTGPIPESLGTLTAMDALDLSNNKLTGTIPLQLGSLTALTFLGLYTNALTGTIPSQLGYLTELMSLDLDENRLTGTVPSQLTALATLTEVHLFNNWLNGSLPFCNNRNNNSSNSSSDIIIDHNMTTFNYLTADCNEVACPCCTHCCPAGGWEGIPVIPADWSSPCD
jgi:Leucine-rich repeat (LRR) protein